MAGRSSSPVGVAARAAPASQTRGQGPTTASPATSDANRVFTIRTCTFPVNTMDAAGERFVSCCTARGDSRGRDLARQLRGVDARVIHERITGRLRQLDVRRWCRPRRCESESRAASRSLQLPRRRPGRLGAGSSSCGWPGTRSRRRPGLCGRPAGDPVSCPSSGSLSASASSLRARSSARFRSLEISGLSGRGASTGALAALGSSESLIVAGGAWGRRLGDARQPELLARLAQLDHLGDHEVARDLQRLVPLAVRDLHGAQDPGVQRQRDQQPGEISPRGPTFLFSRQTVTPAGR